MARISKSQLYRLLYLALIDLRGEGHNAENRLMFLLADLFHNIPLQLDLVDRGDLALEDILRWLRSRARGTPMEAWLNLREQEIMTDEQDERDAPQPDSLHDGGQSP
jgi:hypothetical protein